MTKGHIQGTTLQVKQELINYPYSQVTWIVSKGKTLKSIDEILHLDRWAVSIGPLFIEKPSDIISKYLNEILLCRATAVLSSYNGVLDAAVKMTILSSSDDEESSGQDQEQEGKDEDDFEEDK